MWFKIQGKLKWTYNIELITVMSQEYNNIAFQHKLEILQDQNNELVRQISLLKQSNDGLLNGLGEVEALKQENCTLSLHNKQLTDMLET